MPSGEIYNHETVGLDDEVYSDCEFRNCRLVYAGGEPPVFRSCTFVDCEWKYDEAAARTLTHLRLVWNVGGKAAVQAVIKDITVAR